MQLCFYLCPLKSVKIFIVLKTLTFGKYFSAMLILFDPVQEYVFDVDFLCKFSKLQHNSLAFVAGLKRASDEGSLPEIAQYSPYYLNVLLLPRDQTFLFYLLLLQLVLCHVFTYISHSEGSIFIYVL